MTSIRVPRGAPAPSEQQIQDAIGRDRARLSLPAVNGVFDIAIAGPYHISVNGEDLDEYVMWER